MSRGREHAAYDLLVVGDGAAGEAAATLAGQRGARVAVVERDLFGGECAYWACMPSKTLLDAARRRAGGADYPWERAVNRRDWMILREGIAYPDDGAHVRVLESAGVEAVRGAARIVGPGRVEVSPEGGPPRTLEGRSILIATGSVPVIPPMEGVEEAGYWTSREATALRELPSSIVVVGGGPVGVEMAQVYARFGVRTIIVQSEDRILPRDHPASSRLVAERLAEEGVDLRLGVRGVAVRRGGPGRIIELSDGTTAEGAEVVIAIGRRPAPLRDLGAEEAGVVLDERGGASPDEQMRVADGVFVAGDVAGGMQFTHLADYQGRVVARVALGDDARADLSAVPRTTFTEPETGAVGLTAEEARDRGIDAVEHTADFALTARGYTLESEPRAAYDPEGPDLRRGAPGHVTAVMDRERGVLVGAFAAGPAASETIHVAVLAIKQGIPVPVLADTIGGFPTASRVFTNLMAEMARALGASEGCAPPR